MTFTLRLLRCFAVLLFVALGLGSAWALPVGGKSGNPDPASGAASAIAQSVYAGTLDGTDIDRARALNQAELIGAIAGYLTSGGNPDNVSTAANTARSGLKNNYLSHMEASTRADLIRELEACEASGACSAARMDELRGDIAYWNALDEDRDAALRAACTADAGSSACAALLVDALQTVGLLPRGIEAYAYADFSGSYSEAYALFEEYGAGATGDVFWDDLAAKQALLIEEYASTLALLAPHAEAAARAGNIVALAALLEGVALPAAGYTAAKTTKIAGNKGTVNVPRSVGADIPSTPVHNINEFFNSLTGGIFKSASSRTSKVYDGQRVFRADKDIMLQDGSKIRKGDQFYLDGLHKDHLEVFDARGNPRIKVDLAGNNLGDLPSDRKLK